MEIEELFCKRYPEYSVNGKPLHPYFDVFEEGYEQAEKENEELEKENAELKEKLNFSTQYYQGEQAKDQLTKAKEIIKGLLSCCRNYPQENAEKMEQAEQFLKGEQQDKWVNPVITTNDPFVR